MLISVTDLNNNTEPLNDYQRPEIKEEVNGAFSLAITSFSIPNNPGHVLLEEESIISVEDYDFRIKQMRTDKNRKEVVALSTFFDLIGHRQDLIYGGTRTHKEFLTFIFKGTGWTFSTDVNESKFIPNFGEKNVIELITDLTSAFECEYQIMPNDHVHFAKEVGPDNDAQYRYGHNVKELSKNVDTYNLRTRITGTRPKTDAVEKDGVIEVPAHEGFKVVYTSPFAEKYGIIEAEPIIKDDIRTEAEMIEFIQSELNDYPETSIALDAVELTNKEIGERVWLIYEPIKLADGTFMEFQTRVMSKSSTIRNGKLVTQSVVIGNTIPRTVSDIITDAKIEISNNAKWTRSRIEQTNTKIELAVEEFTGELLAAYAKIELTAREIRLEVADVERDLRSSISITASQIRSEVSAMNVRLTDGVATNKSAITQTASQIRQEVSSEIKRVDGRVDTANSSITQTASSIRSEVATSVGNLDGKISTANSSITQLSNQITSVVNTSIPGLDGRINTAESSIRQQAGEIESKVSQSNYNGDMLVSMINQTASHIKIQAKNISLVGAVTVLSELSNDLGTITAGNINISNDIVVGRYVTVGKGLTSSGSMGLRFGTGGYGGVYYNNGTMGLSCDRVTIDASFGDIVQSTPNSIRFNASSLDASNVGNLVGIPKSTTSGLEFGYDRANGDLVLRTNGVEQARYAKK